MDAARCNEGAFGIGVDVKMFWGLRMTEGRTRNRVKVDDDQTHPNYDLREEDLWWPVVVIPLNCQHSMRSVALRRERHFTIAEK
jgi:hypothetical protein